jgi:hypothetical protein
MSFPLYKDVSTTMIYTHVLNKEGQGVRTVQSMDFDPVYTVCINRNARNRR